MRRLYIKIYLSMLVIIAAVAVLAPLMWWMFGPNREDVRMYDSLGKLAARSLPPLHAPRSEQRRALHSLAEELDVHLSLYGPRGRHIASSHNPLPLNNRITRGWQAERNNGPLMIMHLPDHRILVAAHRKQLRAPLRPTILILGIIIFSLGIYLLVRRLTRRLERLQQAVEKFGKGDLSARVTIEGKDEIASLAERFNDTAGRIENLVMSQKNMLATASHELRTPLTRMRMALELFIIDPKPMLKEELERNIGELDRLIDEILLAGRLDAPDRERRIEELDLLGLLAGEAVHYGVEVSGDGAIIRGEELLLRRLIRNLLENARRYGDDAPVEGSVGMENGEAVLRICDQGPGVPEAERERIFEPFYRPAHVPEGAHGGVGLGLSLVRQIAGQHGGSVRCLPRDGNGSCFEVRLPV